MLLRSILARDQVHCAPLFSIDGSTESRRSAIGPERPPLNLDRIGQCIPGGDALVGPSLANLENPC